VGRGLEAGFAWLKRRLKGFGERGLRWYPPRVSRCSLRLVRAFLAPLALAGWFVGAGAPGFAAEEESVIPILDQGSATAEVDGAPFSISYSNTPLGRLVSLQPLVARLGGELDIGPLGQSHKLTVATTEYVFGPESSKLTFGDEIAQISQPPRPGSGGLHVPLDLLQRIYGEELGYDFRWDPIGRRLQMAQRQMRRIPLSVELVHLQGVSTLVLRFREEPRYRVEKRNGSTVVEMVGDRAVLNPGQQLAPDPLIRGVHVIDERVTIDLVPGADSEHYTLDDGRRLVFEVFPSANEQPVTAAAKPENPLQRRRKVETIVIDPGHGGRDSGTAGGGGLTEKTLTLRIARSLKSTLERRLPVRVVLTRSDDTYLPLETRTAIANQYDAELFISLHLNASRGSNAKGAETYFLSLQATDKSAELFAQAENTRSGGGSVDDLDLILWDLAQNRHLGRSQSLAKMIQSELNERMGITNRGVKQAPFRVLMGARMPAVLVEVGFLSNEEEARRLGTAEYQAELVSGLADAIARYRASVRPAEPDASGAAAGSSVAAGGATAEGTR